MDGRFSKTGQWALFAVCALFFIRAPVQAHAADAPAGGKEKPSQVCPGDSDCDGLSDELEAQIGTDPHNPDTDGDCIPDGVEHGLTKDEAIALVSNMSKRPHYQFGKNCLDILSKNLVTVMENAIPFDESKPATPDNVALLYDLDPSTQTDPTKADTDNDGIPDGVEDFNLNGRRDWKVAEGADPDTPPDENASWLELDPANPDSDGDGLRDGDEGDRDGDGKLGPDESDPLLADTDGDGVPDGVERRMGTKPNVCDTDGDGLSDGVETGAIQPIDKNGCHGLTAAGTNYRRPHQMDPLNPDSDGDGLTDGQEDKNGNGWVDPGESDPSITDTDGDGIDDYVETTGDYDHDGLPDFDYRLIKAGKDCSPPKSIDDLDCDGIPNAVDTDSDDDGCPDAQEGGWVDLNGNGVPDIYDNQAKLCPEPVTGGAGGGASPSESKKDGGSDTGLPGPGFQADDMDGGACTIAKRQSTEIFSVSSFMEMIFLFIILPVILAVRLFLRGSHPKS